MLALKIAWRYLYAKKSHNAVNIITVISVAGIAVATMAMVVVLSIFNGFSLLAESHLAHVDPDLRAERGDGRVFAGADSLCARLADIPGVRGVVPSLSSRALLVSGSAQTPVVFHGVTDNYASLSGVDDAIIDGTYATATTSSDGEVPAAVVSVGVANSLVRRPDAARPIDIYVPRRQGRINPANPAAAFRGQKVAVSGVFAVDQPDFDADNIFIPLVTARALLDYDTEADALRIFTEQDADVDDITKSVGRILGPDFVVLDRLQQHADAFRMISLEKWITFMMMVFILVIALFNIISTLSLLVIEKRANMATMRALGAPHALVRRVFIIEGWLITLVGGAIGLVLGVVLTIVQQYGHVIKLAADPKALTVTSYPVQLQFIDLLAVAVAVAFTGLLASQATRLFVRKN